MKKVIILFLILIFILSVSGCSEKSKIIGDWVSEENNDSTISFLKDNRLIIDNQLGSFEILSDSKIVLTSNTNSIVYSYSIIDGVLSLSIDNYTQTFIKLDESTKQKIQKEREEKEKQKEKNENKKLEFTEQGYSIQQSSTLITNQTFLSDYNKKKITGTQVRSLFNLFEGKPIAIIFVNHNDITNLPSNTWILTNGYLNYNCLLTKDSVISDTLVSGYFETIYENSDLFLYDYREPDFIKSTDVYESKILHKYQSGEILGILLKKIK